MATLLAVAVATMTMCAPSQARSSSHATAKKRAQERRALLRAVKKNPRIVLRPGFVKKASLFGVDLPITIRLTPVVDQAGTPAALDDDGFQIDFGTDPVDPPFPPGVGAGVVSSTLKGNIAASLRFSQDSIGYGGMGTVELGFASIDMTATPFDLEDDATPATCSLANTGPVAVTESGTSLGSVNLLGGSFSIDLRTAFAFSSFVRNTCADPFTATSLMNGSGRPPYPIRLDGTFRISPAITADGRLRLGRMTLSGPQHDSHVEVHTCTTAPPPATCANGSDGVMPGRLLATAFNAEMIVGRVS